MIDKLQIGRDKSRSISSAFVDSLAEEQELVQEGDKVKLKSAVGVVFNKRNQLLLGLAIADDERDGKWTFPGGTIEEGEGCLSAAVRETYEETGIVSLPISSIVFIHPAKPMVGFCLLRSRDETELVSNEEFAELNWVSLDSLPEDLLPLSREILRIINTQI